MPFYPTCNILLSHLIFLLFIPFCNSVVVVQSNLLLTTSINTAFKGADNGNITITVYILPSVTTESFLNGLDSVTFNLTGTDSDGNALTDTISITANDNTQSSSSNFETITQVDISSTGESLSNHKIVVGTGGVRSKMSDYSTSLATITYQRVGKPVSEYIDDLSSSVYTGDVTYLYFIDSNNVLTWKGKSTTSITTISREIDDLLGTEGTDYSYAIELDVERGSFDIITAIRAHLGKDDTGASISTYAFEATAVAKHGWKWSYEDFSEIANQVIEQNSGFNTAQIRDAAKDMGRQYIKAILKRIAYVRYRATATFIFNNGFTKGAQVNVVKPTRGWTVNKPFPLRIMDITNDCTDKGIFTTLSLEEDEESAKITIKDLQEYINV